MNGLARMESRFQAAFDSAPVGIAHIGADDAWRWVNPRLCTLLGRARAELLGRPIAAVTHPEDNPARVAAMAACSNGLHPALDLGLRFLRGDGTIARLSLGALPVREANGEPDGLIAFFHEGTAADPVAREPGERVDLRAYLAKISSSMPGVVCANRRRPDGGVSMPYASENLADIFGVRPEQVSEDSSILLDRIHPDDRERVQASVAESAATLAPWHCEYRVRHPARGELWIEARAIPEAEPDGSVLWHGFRLEITERKLAEAGLRRAAAVLASTPQGVVFAGTDDIITSVNQAFCTMTGYSEAELIGKPVTIIRSGRHTPEFYESLTRSVHELGHWQGEIWNRRKSGEVFPQLVTVSAMRDEAGRPVEFVRIYTDISQLKESESRFEHLAHHDPLTNLPNRLALRQRLEQGIARAGRIGGRGAVLFLDLDRFKNVNDSLGHPAGDELLQVVADRLAGRLRDNDVLARLGGDEFVVLLEDVEEPEDAAHVAQSLIAILSEPVVLSGEREVAVGTSVGISLFPDDGQSADDLIRNADAALYQAKAAGRSTYRFFTVELTRAAVDRLATEARLRHGIEKSEFVLHYQPLVDLRDRRIKGVEALLRWRDSAGGLVLPGQFIPVAEETGLIVPLGEWVMRTACAQMKQWRAAGIAIDTIAVNLSPKQFRERDLDERIQATLAASGLAAHHLEIEITEGALMEQARDAETRLAALKAMGVRLAIDDFGVGYSSLAYLKRFAIDKLKMDRSFVAGIPDDVADMEIVAAVIALARTLRLEVLAEGVETEAQLAFLSRHGCDTGQGYLFAHPLPTDEITALLRRGL